MRSMFHDQMPICASPSLERRLPASHAAGQGYSLQEGRVPGTRPDMGIHGLGRWASCPPDPITEPPPFQDFTRDSGAILNCLSAIHEIRPDKIRKLIFIPTCDRTALLTRRFLYAGRGRVCPSQDVLSFRTLRGKASSAKPRVVSHGAALVSKYS